MGALGYAGSAMQVGGTVVNAEGDAAQTKSSINYYKYLSAVSSGNAGIAEAAGKAESEQIGASAFQQEGKLEMRNRATIGAQTAALAAGGAGTGSKTAEQVVSDTINKTSLDEQVLRYNTGLGIKNASMNAAGQAFNYRSQGAGYDMAAANAKVAGEYKMWSTILGGASSTMMSASMMQNQQMGTMLMAMG